MVSYMCYVFALIFITGTMTVEAGKSSEEMQGMMACMNLSNPEVMKCCSVLDEMSKNKGVKCNVQGGELTCDQAKCIVKEDGLDGDNIDIGKANKMLEEAVDKHPELKDVADRIKKNCLEDRHFENYPPKECPAAGFVICTFMNFITECPEWKDTEKCQKFAQDAQICKNAIDNM